MGCSDSRDACIPHTQWVTQPQTVLGNDNWVTNCDRAPFPPQELVNYLCIPEKLKTVEAQNDYCASACAYIRATEGLNINYAGAYFYEDGMVDEGPQNICECFVDCTLDDFELQQVTDDKMRIISVPEECKQYGDQKNFYGEKTCHEDYLGINDFKRDNEKLSKFENKYSKYINNARYTTTFDKLEKEIEQKVNVCSLHETDKEYKQMSKRLEKQSRQKEIKKNKNRRQQLKKKIES